MKKNIWRRILAFGLMLVMILGVIPETSMTVLANEHENQVRVIVKNETYSVDEGAAWDGLLVDEWVTIDANSSVMSALVDALEMNGKSCEGAESNYITAIEGLEAGGYWYMDGWMILLNDWLISAGAGDFTVANGSLTAGDEICVAYSLDMGDDLGGTYYNNDTSVKEIQFSAGALAQDDIDAIREITNDGEEEKVLPYTLTVPAGTTEIVVTPTARNKNFQVRTYLNEVKPSEVGYKRSQGIPVKDKDTIYVVCGHPEWPCMNTNEWGNGSDCFPTTYAFTVVFESAGNVGNPSIRTIGDDDEDGMAELSYDITEGETYTVALADLFEVTDATFNGLAELDEILAPSENGDTNYDVVEVYENLTLADEINYTFTEAGDYELVIVGEIEEDEEAFGAVIVSFHVVPLNHAPVLTDAYASGNATEDRAVEETYTLDLTEVFADADEDELAFYAKVGEADYVAVENGLFTYTASATGTVNLVFKANDGVADSEPYSVVLEVGKRIAKLNSLIIHTGLEPDSTGAVVLLQNEGDSYGEEVSCFDPDTLTYVLDGPLYDGTSTSLAQLRFRALAANENDKVTLYYKEGSKDITGTGGSSAYMNFLRAGTNTFSIVVESRNESANVEKTTYEFTLYLKPVFLSMTTLGDTYWENAYSADSRTYQVEVADSAKELEIFSSRKDVEQTVTYNGKLDSRVDISNTDTVEIVLGAGAVSTTYTLNLIRKPDTSLNLNVTPADAIVSIYNNNEAAVPACADGSYALIDGYDYTYTVSKNGYVSESGTVPENRELRVKLNKILGEQPKEVDAYWPSFRGSASNMAITSARTPQNEDAESIAVKWVKELKENGQYPSVQIIADNALVVMCNKTLYKFDLDSGETIATATMADAPNWGYTPPTYGAGMIFCPLKDGRIQAFDATTLKSLWIYEDALKGQSISPITYADGYIYTGFWTGESKNANFVCINVADEDVLQEKEAKQAAWTHSQQGGFYWAGSVVAGDAVIVGTDDGVNNSSGTSYLYSFERESGTIISKLELSGAGDQRSSIAYDQENGSVYFTTKGGYLYRANVNEETGVVSGLKRAALGKQSTSTPVVYKGRVYLGVGNGISSTGSQGALAVCKADTLEKLFEVPLLGYPQCSMLLSTAYEAQTGCVYLYSTYNSAPGGISVIKMKTDCVTAADATLTELYDANGYAQYCIASMICGEDGTLYYKNDSGAVFAIGVPTLRNVEKLIEEIGTVTLQSEGAIKSARGAYDALDVAQKQQVSNYEKLTAAEKAYQELLNEQDEAVAAEVEKLIDNIGKVTVNSGSRIKKARTAYEKLTEAQKKFVGNYSDLVLAEEAYEDAQVEYVEDLIDEVGTVTLESKTKINRARTAYNKLPENLWDEVQNYHLLEAAEIAYAKLQSDAKKTASASKTTKSTKGKTLAETNLSVRELLETLTENSNSVAILDAILAYEELKEEEKIALDKDRTIENLKEQLAEQIKTDKNTGIRMDGEAWNVRLVVEHVLDITQIQSLQEKLGGHEMLGLWDIHLEDYITEKPHAPKETVMISIPVALLGDYAAYDGLAIAHYLDDGTVEYLNCVVVGSNVMFNAIEFSHYAVVGYSGESPVEGHASHADAAGIAGAPWIPWAAGGMCGVVLLGVLLYMKKKTAKTA